jgi:hypothetical protein
MTLYESFRNNKHITVFDVDDTLVVTKSKIKVSNPKTGFYKELTPQDFNEFERRDHDEMDFSDFKDLDILKAGRIIEWVFDILKRTISKGDPVGIITARDDAKLIYDFLSYHGVRIDPSYIFAINDPNSGFTGTIAERKKQAFVKLIEQGFRRFTFFDDDKENIKIAKSLTKDFPDIKMDATLIKKKWIPKFDDWN